MFNARIRLPGWRRAVDCARTRGKRAPRISTPFRGVFYSVGRTIKRETKGSMSWKLREAQRLTVIAKI
jgi:hypothetical protein